jgi:hypothetical protein
MALGEKAIPTFLCPESDCKLRWNRQFGYFCLEEGRVIQPRHDFLKHAFIPEHGYFYLVSVEMPSGGKIWRCSVPNCRNTTIEG